MTELTALPAERHRWENLLSRPDIEVHDGTVRLLDQATPAEAQRADLLMIAEALETAGIPVLLIRHGVRDLALVVDAARRADAYAALRRCGADEPLYVKPRGGTAHLAVDLDDTRTDAIRTNAGAEAIRVYRPRRAGSLTFGAAQAVRLEFWRTEDGVVHAPRANALTRRVFVAADVEHVTVEREGRAWTTLRGMFDLQPDEIDFPIDMVFSWVDGSSSEFQRQRAAQMAEYVVGEGDDGPARFRHVDELRYALRSVHLYAPWVRRIFIATDSPAPAWLRDDPKVTIVRSEEFFADPSVLPTHNSHAVEAQLHRIEGLAEHFLYSNDDMFFARPVGPELFFTAAGVSKFVECPVRIGTGPSLAHRSGHDNALRVNRALLEDRFGRVILRDLEHCAAPLRRSVMRELEGAFPADIARTAASRFRSATDVSVTNSLYHYFALMTGRAIATTVPRVRYVQTTMAASLGEMQRLERQGDVDMFCLNDGGAQELPEQLRVQTLRATLERMFPIPAPWERATGRSAHPAGRAAEKTGAAAVSAARGGGEAPAPR